MWQIDVELGYILKLRKLEVNPSCDFYWFFKNKNHRSFVWSPRRHFLWSKWQVFDRYRTVFLSWLFSTSDTCMMCFLTSLALYFHERTFCPASSLFFNNQQRSFSRSLTVELYNSFGFKDDFTCSLGRIIILFRGIPALFLILQSQAYRNKTIQRLLRIYHSLHIIFQFFFSHGCADLSDFIFRRFIFSLRNIFFPDVSRCKFFLIFWLFFRD